MSAAPIASGAKAEWLRTAVPTVKTSPKVPMNSVTYFCIRNHLTWRAARLLSRLRVPNRRPAELANGRTPDRHAGRPMTTPGPAGIRTVQRRLRAHQGTFVPKPRLPVLDELVATVLSQHTSD